MSLLKRLIDHKKQRADQAAIQYIKKGQLYTLKWAQVYDRVEQYYNVLLYLGVKPGDKVALYSNTNKEWGFLDLAIMACGATTVPVYHSSHIEEVEFILKDSKPSLLFVENEGLYNNILSLKIEDSFKEIVSLQSFHNLESTPQFLNELVDNPDTIQQLTEISINSEDLATIIYTSGTSGKPKGVCLTHNQIMSSVAEVFPLLGVTDRDKTLTFLPYSHVLGRMELWGHYFCGYCIGYAQSIDKIKKDITKVQPTVIVGVPRIFEKIFLGIKSQVEISKLKEGLFNQAMNIGKANTKLRQEKKSPSLFQALKSQLAYQVVFSNIQKKLGGRLRFAVSGGAPLDTEISNFFSACGITVLEGYGLTETTGPVFVNTLFQHKNGYVGRAIGDVEVKFESDGEILIKSQKVMTEYYNNSEETQKVLTDDGFFRTGDIGELDEEGFLKITDRKKDLIKTAGGKFIAPQKIQGLFSQNPLIGHVHIHGDKEKYVVALLTLEKDELFTLKNNYEIKESDFASLSQNDQIQNIVRKAVSQVNANLASFETIKRYKVLDHEFTIEDGHLTPSLKMKRQKIDQMYDDDLKKLYL